MTVLYHPDFAGDIVRFANKYSEISPKLGIRFRHDVDAALVAIITSPTSEGRFVNTGSLILREVRRNLAVFPFFVLYGQADDRLVFGSVIPSASDPLFWLKRFE